MQLQGSVVSIKELVSANKFFIYFSSLSRLSYFILAIAFQILLVLIIIINYWIVLATGTEVVFEIEGLDPIDLFRGHYLEYRIKDLSRVKIDKNLGENLVRKNDLKIIYVPIKKEGKYWKAYGNPAVKKPKDSEDIFIRGIVLLAYVDELRLLYGIERFYIPEKYASKLESLARSEKLAIVVSVDSNGFPVVKDLLINDKPWTNYIK